MKAPFKTKFLSHKAPIMHDVIDVISDAIYLTKSDHYGYGGTYYLEDNTRLAPRPDITARTRYEERHEMLGCLYRPLHIDQTK